jgi:glycosyltransferase involved in cell wall biosynthesis
MNNFSDALLSSESMHILLFQRIVPDYRVPIFRMLFEKCGIIVCHSREKSGASIVSNYGEIDYPNMLLNRIYFPKKENFVIQNVLIPLLKSKPEVVISEFSLGYLTFWALLFLKPIFKYKFIAWTHGLSNKEMIAPFSSVKNKIALFIYKKLDSVIFYSSLRKQLASKHLKTDRGLFVAPNTIDTSELISLHEKFRAVGRDNIRKELNFREKYHLIFIGRLLKGKRIDLLLAVFEKLQSTFDIALHVIGMGPELEVVRRYDNKLQSLYYHGAIFDNKITGKYLYASDILLNPGYIGLSIVSAFAFAKPVITCRTTPQGPFHSPEFEYLKHGKNSFLCHPTVESISSAIKKLLEDRELLISMSHVAFETAIKDCSPEKMIRGFQEAIAFVSEKCQTFTAQGDNSY